MTKTKRFIPYGAAMLCALLAMSCSEDSNEKKYGSEPPLFEDVTLKSLSTGSSEIHAGERFVATAVQRKRGKLLYKATYSWADNDKEENVSHKYKQSVVYDQEPADPTDTLVIKKAGTYTLSFSGKYQNSGNTSYWGNKYGYSFSENYSKGFNATYSTGGAIGFTVSATKTITILP